LVVLQRCLSAAPKLFVDLLKLIFRAEGEEPAEVSEEQQARATQAFRLLRKWSVLPGTVRINAGEGDDEAIMIEEDSLRAWVAVQRQEYYHQIIFINDVRGTLSRHDPTERAFLVSHELPFSCAVAVVNDPSVRPTIEQNSGSSTDCDRPRVPQVSAVGSC
jgi:hypothetical protein